MLVTVQSQSNQLSTLSEDYIESKIRLMLGRYDDVIKQTNVSLQAADDPLGTFTTSLKNYGQCVITIILNSHHIFEVQDDGNSIVAALDNCMHRVKRTIERHFKLAGQL